MAAELPKVFWASADHDDAGHPLQKFQRLIELTEFLSKLHRGDVVAIVGPDGHTVAQGLTNYGAEDVARIRGLKSSQFKKVLGDRPYDEVIHADNLVVRG